jgi:hypothetical protein
MTPGLRIFFEKYFVFATPPKPFKGFWLILTKKGYIVKMCILYGEPCPIIFHRVMAPGLCYFYEKYFVFAILPKTYVQYAGVHITKRMLFPAV